MRVLITGASRGIGKEFVRHYLAAGDEVHAVTRNPAKLADLANSKLTVHAVDLEAKDGAATLAKAFEGRAIDLLVNNAGTFLDRQFNFKTLPIDVVTKSFEVNTILPMRLCQALLPNLLAGKSAKVAQITSLMGSIADNSSGGCYGYRMSKTALNMFNRCFSLDHPSLTSIVFHPGWVKTDMGGENAPTSVEDSVRGMTKILAGLKNDQTGKFYDFEGEELPW